LTRLNPLLPAWRLLRLAEHLATGAVLGVGVAVFGVLDLQRPWLPGLVAWWHRRLGRCLGLRIEQRGVPVSGALFALNHVSWLDIPVVGGLEPVRFVSKAEVRRWPLIGWLAGLAGTLFLQRGAHQASALAETIREQLRLGATVGIFPEGTTGDGRALRRFHARLFSAAAGDVQVQPVAIRYGHGVEPDQIAPFIGDDSLLPHLWRVLRHPGLAVTASFLTPIEVRALSRKQLAVAARDAIDAQLRQLAEEAAPIRCDQPHAENGAVATSRPQSPLTRAADEHHA
jgi:1-acyl-sn-glycerol-3-phosphate acyltransferase